MSNNTPELYVGLDVSEKSIEIFALRIDAPNGKSGRIANDRDQLESFCAGFKHPQNVLIALETGTHSPWISELLLRHGFQVAVGNARKLAAVWKSQDKNDRNDAEMLARLARSDLNLFAPIQHQNAESRADLAVIKLRNTVSECRTKMMNAVRGTLRSFGADDEAVTPENFSKEIGKVIPRALRPAMKGILKEIRMLQLTIRDYDKQVEKLCRKYPDTEKVGQIAGVGPLTALSFILIMGRPERFNGGGGVCKYLGLTPKRDQSGEVDKQLGITKTGNALMRRLLVQAANYIISRGPACDLRRAGERIASRGGKIARRKAKIAVARRTAKLMFRLWKTGEKYDPDHKANAKTTRKRECADRPLVHVLAAV